MPLWINAIVVTILAILGAIMGGEYKSPQYVGYLVILIFYGSMVTILNTKNNELKAELKAEKDKLSSVMIQAGNSGQNFFYIAVHTPYQWKNPLPLNRNFILEVFVNAPYDLLQAPEIKIITQSNWTIKAQSIPVHANKYAGKYEYFLGSKGLDTTYRSQKMFKYKFELNISSSGANQFEIVADSGGMKSTLVSSLDVA